MEWETSKQDFLYLDLHDLTGVCRVSFIWKPGGEETSSTSRLGRFSNDYRWGLRSQLLREPGAKNLILRIIEKQSVISYALIRVEITWFSTALHHKIILRGFSYTSKYGNKHTDKHVN